MSPVKIAIAQINCTVGDLAGNAELIFRQAHAAAQAGADVLITPELSLVGYPPEDLLLRPALYVKCAAVLADLRTRLAVFPGLHVLVGHPVEEGGKRYNAVSVLANGYVVGHYRKRALPNYDVFDEIRYFSPDGAPCVFAVKGLACGVNICEDTWSPAAPAAARAAGAHVLLVPNASPFHQSKQEQRHAVMRANVSKAGLALVYCNMVGGQDELVFDGASFVLDAAGRLAAQLPQFEAAQEVVEFNDNKPMQSRLVATTKPVEQVYRALVLGVRDYLGKNGFPGAIIGLSGGVDSALTLAVALDALGADKVRAVMMPSPYTAEISWIDSRDMVKRIGVQYDEVNIGPMFDAFRGALAPLFQGLAEDTTEENIQARVRGTLLMALSNKTGRIVLTTGNKSEFTTGYCTLYGDMAGGFAVIKDVSKTLVYQLCAWRNGAAGKAAYGQGDVIPERILTRAPSAELRPNQTDQDSLPPYDTLDAIMRAYVEEDTPLEDILAAGFAEADVRRVVRLLQVNEYKRRQSPPGIRVTHRAFGRDWRYPITNRFRE